MVDYTTSCFRLLKKFNADDTDTNFLLNLMAKNHSQYLFERVIADDPTKFKDVTDYLKKLEKQTTGNSCLPTASTYPGQGFTVKLSCM
jgi:hypothetical protein